MVHWSFQVRRTFTIDVICRDNISVLVECVSSPDFLIAKFNSLVFPVNSSSSYSTVLGIFDMFHVTDITIHKKKIPSEVPLCLGLASLKYPQPNHNKITYLYSYIYFPFKITALSSLTYCLHIITHLLYCNWSVSLILLLSYYRLKLHNPSQTNIIFTSLP